MNTLIVFSHPEPQSFNGAMLRLAVSELASRGHSVDVVDLYQINFNPVPSSADFSVRKDSKYFQLMREQFNAFEKGGLAPDILVQQEKLTWADLVIFQFPLWWSGLPGILKGYFDRVFTYGFAYGGTKGRFQNGGFHGKRAMLSMSLASSHDEFRQPTLEQLLHPIHDGILRYCGFEVVKPFVACEIHHNSSLEIIRDQLERYRARLRRLDT